MKPFLFNYKTYTQNTESHPNYHLYCALVVLASIVSRRVWVELGPFRIYPNLYVVLVGPPGYRKTSAMSVAKKLLRDVKDVPFSAEAMTRESLIRYMAEQKRSFINPADMTPVDYCPTTVCVTELSEFVGSANAAMVNFLTTVYDQDFYDYKTKNRGDDYIIGPALTILGCTTPAWISARLRDDVISGGFSRRALFVYEYEPIKRIAKPPFTPDMEEAFKEMVEWGIRLKDVCGKFTWEKDAEDFYVHWYENIEIPKDSSVSGYYETKHNQLLKVAMLAALSEGLTCVLKKHHIEFALGILGLIEDNLPKVFAGIGRNQLSGARVRMLELLKIAGGTMPEKHLRVAMERECSVMEMAEVLDHLRKTDQIEVYHEPMPRGPARTIIALPKAVREELPSPEPATSEDSVQATDPTSAPE